jgi:hypothetical protein
MKDASEQACQDAAAMHLKLADDNSASPADAPITAAVLQASAVLQAAAVIHRLAAAMERIATPREAA